jgi:CO/xanthine dehydrogenase FAD-binding subunit
VLPKFNYAIPSTLSEANDFLAQYGPETKIIAGGTDLVLALRQRRMNPRFVLDISGLDELRRIEEKEDHIVVGAACTHTQISESSILRQWAGILSEASGSVGSRQIRNLGTIGGNLVNGSPAADTVPALMVLDAKLDIVSNNHRRQVLLPEFYKGPYHADLKPEEVLSSIIIKKIPENAKCHFFRVARRKAMATARINGAVVLWQKKDGGPIENIRISIGSVTPIPCRMWETEKLLNGTIPSEETIERACKLVGQAMVEASGLRKSTEYKQPVVCTLVNRAIKDTLAKDGGWKKPKSL